MSPKISVIIPTYNRAQVLSRALASVMKQSFDGYELIVVDDGSTDNTQEILGTLRKISKFQVLQTENRGVSAARNIGVECAQAPWIAFLDSDDEWFPNKLEKQWAMIQNQSELVLVHGEEIWIRNGVRVNAMKKHAKKGGDVFADAVRLCCISPSTAVVKKELFMELGGFREDFPVCEDYDLWLKITAHHAVGFVEDPIIRKYGGHEDQLSRRFKAMDYWRIRSLFEVLKCPISIEKRELARAELLKKGRILLNGYLKHENMEHYDEVFQYLNSPLVR